MAVLVQSIGAEGRGSPKIGDFGFDKDPTFESAVFMSLFLNARAEPDDELDDPEDVQGYWGESYGFPAGSRLWTLRRKTRTQTVMNLVEEYATESLQWMVRDRILTEAIATATATTNGAARIDLVVRLTRRDGTKWESRWLAVLG